MQTREQQWIIGSSVLHNVRFETVVNRRSFMLTQGAIVPKPEPCSQMFWLQQQHEVYQGRSLTFKICQNAFPPRTPLPYSTQLNSTLL